MHGLILQLAALVVEDCIVHKMVSTLSSQDPIGSKTSVRPDCLTV